MKTQLTIQNYGSAVLVYVSGETREDVYAKWMSLYNWGATATDFSPVTETVAACWSTMEKLQRYFFNLRITELARNRGTDFKGKMGGFAALAKEMAEKDFSEIQRETFRSVGEANSFYEFGTITAERPDDDFKDAVIKDGYNQAAERDFMMAL